MIFLDADRPACRAPLHHRGKAPHAPPLGMGAGGLFL